jgi:SAM-dependent methyltransferase
MSQSVWDNRYSGPLRDEWTSPSWFAQFARGYFPAQGRILELGAGAGHDSRFFAGLRYEVVSTDSSGAALKLNTSLIPDDLKPGITVRQLDITHDFPFMDAYFEVVYASLCIHYFGMVVTHHIIDEISRVLKPDGVFAFIVNSTSDPDYGQGPCIEEDFFQIGKDTKRYFNVASARKIVSGFETIILDNRGKAYWQSKHGKHNLIRFVGKKRIP